MELNNADKLKSLENLDAIFLIPGFTTKEKNLILHLVGKEFKKAGAKEVKKIDRNNCTIKQFQIDNRLIDVYEAYWADLIEDLTKMELTQRVPRGAYLLVYWLHSGIFNAFHESILLVLGSTTLLFTIVFWYFITILLIFVQVVKELDINFLSKFKSLTGWIWLVNTFLIGLLPVSTTANLVNFAERYFEDEFTKDKINERVLENLSLILERNYSTVTVVSHSFGAIIGTNLIAGINDDKNIRYITLGSPLKFFSLKSKRIKNDLFKTVKSCKNKVYKWIEYYSEQDPLCIKMYPEGKYENLEIKMIQLKNSQGKLANKFGFDWMIGNTHNFYFYSQEVIYSILNLQE